jgi:thermitase
MKSVKSKYNYSLNWFKSQKTLTKILVLETLILFIAVLITVPFVVMNRMNFNSRASAPETSSTTPLDQKTKHVPGQLLIKFKDDIPLAVQDAEIKKHKSEKIKEIPQIKIKVIKVPEAELDKVKEALSHNPNVEFVEENYIGSGAETIPNDPLFTSDQLPNGLNDVKITLAWDKSKGSASTIIASLDSGVELNHPDLVDNLIQGRDIVNNDSVPKDDSSNGHGTSVAGLAGATTNNSKGVAGLCWRCSIMPVKVINSSNFVSWADLSEGIIWATDHGAKVISMSLYGYSGGSVLQSAINYAHDRNVILFAAAGNEGSNSQTWPAANSNVVGVAGIKPDGTLYSWSNYGDWVKIAAPGNITTIRRTTDGTNYWKFYGTSAATPIAAGIAALAFAANPNLTNTQIEQAIYNSAVNTGAPVKYGLINANRMINQLLTPHTPTPTPTIVTAPTPYPTNGGLDVIKPITSITYPLNGAVLKGAIIVKIAASDNVGVTKVELYINNAFFRTKYASPYEVEWHTATFANGNYSLYSKAYDNNGNIGTSPTKSVTVRN